MDISLLSIILFVLTTIIYFTFPIIGKPELTFDILNDPQKIQDYNSSNIRSLGFYLLFVMVTQFLLNSSYLMSKCGGNIGKNMPAAALFTFVPWVFIFGIMIAVLYMFPAFKSAFSDVIGYYFVSSNVDDIFSKILLGTDINKIIDNTTDPSKKQELTQTAETLLKICGNKSILINQMNTDNFRQIWQTLKPLMQPGAFEDINLQQSLLEQVVRKENIGEGLWYIYTAILISSIVYYNLSARGCIKDVGEMITGHKKFIKQQEKEEKKSELNNSTSYVA